MTKRKIVACVQCAQPQRKQKHSIGCGKRKALFVKPVSPSLPKPLAASPARFTQNHLILVVDRSSSMSGYYDLPQKVVNDQLKAAQLGGRANNIDTLLSIVEFNDRATYIARSVSLDIYLGLGGYAGYRASGNTNLLEAVQLGASEGLSNSIPKLFIVITDGEHNTYNNALNGRAEEDAFRRTMDFITRGNKDWTVAFIGPKRMMEHAQKFGVPAGNCQVWEGGARELEATSLFNTRAIGARYENLAKGVSMTANYVADAQVNNPADIKKLQDVTGFMQHLVDAPAGGDKWEVKNFVEKVTKKTYQPGSLFYELTKPEKVQSYKGLFVQDRATGALLGDSPVFKVRSAINLPLTGDAKVSPGNLKGFTVFVESTSVNRKLVPGTRVLVRS